MSECVCYNSLHSHFGLIKTQVIFNARMCVSRETHLIRLACNDNLRIARNSIIKNEQQQQKKTHTTNNIVNVTMNWLTKFMMLIDVTPIHPGCAPRVLFDLPCHLKFYQSCDHFRARVRRVKINNALINGSISGDEQRVSERVKAREKHLQTLNIM